VQEPFGLGRSREAFDSLQAVVWPAVGVIVIGASAWCCPVRIARRIASRDHAMVRQFSGRGFNTRGGWVAVRICAIRNPVA